jgi:inorganic pyrophosphatase
MNKDSYNLENLREQYDSLKSFIKSGLNDFTEYILKSELDHYTTLKNLTFKFICQIPINSFTKYQISKNVIKIDRLMPYRMPSYYGFIPDTLSQDQDPIDVNLIVLDKMQPNILQNSETEFIPLFMMEGLDRGVKDNKVIGMPIWSLDPKELKELNKNDLIFHKILNLTSHFHNYKSQDFVITKIKGFKSCIEYISNRKIL